MEQLTIFSEIDKPELYSMVYFRHKASIKRGIVVKNDGLGYIIVSSEGNVRHTLGNWYNTRSEATAMDQK